jgi:hypothetical protein
MVRTDGRLGCAVGSLGGMKLPSRRPATRFILWIWPTACGPALTGRVAPWRGAKKFNWCPRSSTCLISLTRRVASFKRFFFRLASTSLVSQAFFTHAWSGEICYPCPQDPAGGVDAGTGPPTAIRSTGCYLWKTTRLTRLNAAGSVIRVFRSRPSSCWLWRLRQSSCGESPGFRR